MDLLALLEKPLVFIPLIAVLGAAYLLILVTKKIQELRSVTKSLHSVSSKLHDLTRSKQEIIEQDFHGISQRLLRELPPLVSSYAGMLLNETEHKIVLRLAELDSSIAKDPAAKAKMEDIITTLERLEDTVEDLTRLSVERILGETLQETLSGQNNCSQ